MRMWVKPDRLAKLGVTVPEIVSAIQAQNTVNPAGKVGGEPAPKGTEFTYAVLAQSRLVSPEEFGAIVVRETPDGGTVRVRDLARIELGSQDYTIGGRFNGKPSAAIVLYQPPGSSAVDAAAAPKKLMAQMKERFPEDLDFVIALDATRAVTEGITEIVLTLVIAPCSLSLRAIRLRVSSANSPEERQFFRSKYAVSLRRISRYLSPPESPPASSQWRRRRNASGLKIQFFFSSAMSIVGLSACRPGENST